MKARTTAILFLALLILGTLVGAADGDLERQVRDAKAAYEANPNPATLVALEQAVAALEASWDRPQRQPTGVAVETETNDTAGTADALGQNDYGQGDISPAGDVDWWTNSYSSLVDDLTFAYVDTSASTGTDSQLNVYANDGTTLIEFDDDAGPNLSSCAAGGVVPQAGSVYYRVNEFQNNGEISPYYLCAQALRATAAESESNDTPGTATAWSYTVMTGNATGADIDYFSFSANAGDLLAMILDEDPNLTGVAMDSGISIHDTDGSTVLATGDNNNWNDDNCAGEVTLAPSTGTYYVSVTNDGATGGDYRFVICVDGRVPVKLQSLAVE